MTISNAVIAFFAMSILVVGGRALGLLALWLSKRDEK